MNCELSMFAEGLLQKTALWPTSKEDTKWAIVENFCFDGTDTANLHEPSITFIIDEVQARCKFLHFISLHLGTPEYDCIRQRKGGDSRTNYDFWSRAVNGVCLLTCYLLTPPSNSGFNLDPSLLYPLKNKEPFSNGLRVIKIMMGSCTFVHHKLWLHQRLNNHLQQSEW